MDVGAGSAGSQVPSPSPEATGGKGTVLEHRFGGQVLAALLLHAPIDGLGSALVPVRVQFQGAEAVDDLVVERRAQAPRSVVCRTALAGRAYRVEQDR